MLSRRRPEKGLAENGWNRRASGGLAAEGRLAGRRGNPRASDLFAVTVLGRPPARPGELITNGAQCRRPQDAGNEGAA